MPQNDSARLHICLVTETYPPEINGVALTLRTLAHSLAAQGHAVSLLRPRQPRSAGDAGTGFDELLVPGAALPRYPGLRFGLPVTGRLAGQWRKNRPDVIYAATEGPLGWAAVRVARRLRIPVATGFHTRFDDYLGHYGLRLLTPVAFAWLRRFHNQAQATLVPTAQLRDVLSGKGFRNVQVLRRAVDVRRFDPVWRDAGLRRQWGLDDDDLAVMYVGRIAAEKNLALAVRAFEEIAARQPRARFILVGDGPARAGLSRAHPDFVFSGLQLGEDLSRHYASGDLFLFPSLTETFGNVTLEAMASGVATVAFDYGAAHEHIVDPGLGRAVPCADEAAFIAAAVELAGDSGLRRRIGAAARTSLQGLDPEGLAERFVALARDLQARSTA
ncbi:glycosyltransferase family 4 protein [Pseudofulvimonas gallinarii]|uniref:Glycosyltransferase involved in cell wall biosynthesis n=1 Tax=Pseudofulvimonas gallinarii TaxID=634155 RepID=A0A4R3LNG2_9GAMM|nr:glycosyltransferase family 1 protein [Pseudofulvimonas gallinarii]TCT00045.1 glycosyltransferase involved in cell wall biosynthesis [Pseudofulvimonas gallinarii]